MSEIGSITSYVMAQQQLQVNLIKQSQEIQEELLEVLMDITQNVPVSSDKGTSLDIKI